MKKITPIVKIAILGFLLSLAACNEADSLPDSNELTESEAAEDIGASLVSDLIPITGDLGGLALGASDGRINGRTEACGISYDTTLIRSYQGSYLSSESSFTYGYELVCEGLIPSSLNIELAGSGTRSTNRLTSEVTFSGNLVVTGVLPTSNTYLINGNVLRNGSLFSEEKEFASTSDMTITNLEVSKTANDIRGGSASLTYASNSSSSSAVTYFASIHFVGEGEAELTINDYVFVINLESGEATEQ